MTPLEMKAICIDALLEPAYCGVIFTVEKGGLPKKFPRGELLNEMKREGVVQRTYNFNPMKVLQYLKDAEAKRD